MEEGAPLQIPCVVTKVTTVNTGGWNVNFHIPDIHGHQVKELIGLENRQVFVMFLVKGDGTGVADGSQEGLPEWAKKKKKK